MAAIISVTTFLLFCYALQVKDVDLQNYFRHPESMISAALLTGIFAGGVIQQLIQRLRRGRDKRLTDDKLRNHPGSDQNKNSPPPSSPYPSRHLLARFGFPLHHTAKKFILKYGSAGFRNFAIDASTANDALRYRKYFLDAGLPDALPVGTAFDISDRNSIWIAADGRIFKMDHNSIILLGTSAEEVIERMASESPLPTECLHWKFEEPLTPLSLIEAIPGPWDFVEAGREEFTSSRQDHERLKFINKRADYLRSYIWENYSHAYGPAGDTPAFLADLTSEDEETREVAVYDFLWSAAYHQFDVYTVTPLVVRYVIMILNDEHAASLPIQGQAISHELVHFCYCCVRGNGSPEIMASINQALRSGREIFQGGATVRDVKAAREVISILDHLDGTGGETTCPG